MSWANPINFGDYSSQQHFTTTYTLKKLSASPGATAMVSAKRFTYGGANDTAATDISARATVNGQVVTLADFFLTNGDPPVVGTIYRVQLVARNNDGTAQDEVNVFFRVPD